MPKRKSQATVQQQGGKGNLKPAPKKSGGRKAQVHQKKYC